MAEGAWEEAITSVPRARDFCRISRRENGVDIADSFSPRYGSTGRGVGVEGSVRLIVYAFVSTMGSATTANGILNSGSLERAIAAIITASGGSPACALRRSFVSRPFQR